MPFIYAQSRALDKGFMDECGTIEEKKWTEDVGWQQSYYAITTDQWDFKVVNQ